MRLLFSSIVTAGLLASHLAAAQSCTRPAEKAAFDIVGLKSQLMVTALSCQLDEKYNAFVRRFQPDLAAVERSLNSYFGRTSGRHAQQEHDDYVTNLANAQSENGIQSGTLFCSRSAGLFDEVLALKSSAELAGFAASKSLTQPIELVECGGVVPAQTRTIAAVAPASPRKR